MYSAATFLSWNEAGGGTFDGNMCPDGNRSCCLMNKDGLKSVQIPNDFALHVV
jgi:hypothetical protein